eukprot:947911_1
MASLQRIIPFDALGRSSLIESIKSCSKPQLLSCLSSMEVVYLRELIVASLIQAQPENKPVIETHCNREHRYLEPIQQFFTNYLHKQERNDSNALCRLPSCVGSYILSFSSMRDRMKQELTSKDLYRFGQIPMAKHHLVIDHSLCKALYLNQIVSQKYFNAQFMEISYVFLDGSYETFEDKYYSFLSKVISKSPLLHTIKFNLKFGKFKPKLFTTSNERFYGHTGHLLEWMNSVIKHSTNPHVFESVTRCIWGPSQFRVDSEANKPSKWRKEYDFFCKYLPNLTQFTLQNSRCYRTVNTTSPYTFRRVMPYDDTDCAWSIFKEPFYHDKLEHIDCNMNINKRMAPRSRWRGRNIRIPNHPLSHLHK